MNSREIMRAHGLYQCGMSLSKIAPRFNTTKGRLWSKFKNMGLRLRTQKKRHHIEHGGLKYYRDDYGFYRSGSRKNRTYLHYLIWGETVAKGFFLAFRDGNKENITKENLELIKKEEALRYAKQRNRQG